MPEKCNHPSNRTYYGAEKRTPPDENGNINVYREKWCRKCDRVVSRHPLRVEKKK
jgi:hypothetical protein